MDCNLILLQIGICVGRGNKPITFAIRQALVVDGYKFWSMSPINERVRGVFCRILAQQRQWWVVTGDNTEPTYTANYPRDYRMFSFGNFSGNWFTIRTRPSSQDYTTNM